MGKKTNVRKSGSDVQLFIRTPKWVQKRRKTTNRRKKNGDATKSDHAMWSLCLCQAD